MIETPRAQKALPPTGPAPYRNPCPPATNTQCRKDAHKKARRAVRHLRARSSRCARRRCHRSQPLAGRRAAAAARAQLARPHAPAAAEPALTRGRKSCRTRCGIEVVVPTTYRAGIQRYFEILLAGITDAPTNVKGIA